MWQASAQKTNSPRFAGKCGGACRIRVGLDGAYWRAACVFAVAVWNSLVSCSLIRMPSAVSKRRLASRHSPPLKPLVWMDVSPLGETVTSIILAIRFAPVGESAAEVGRFEVGVFRNCGKLFSISRSSWSVIPVLAEVAIATEAIGQTSLSEQDWADGSRADAMQSLGILLLG